MPFGYSFKSRFSKNSNTQKADAHILRHTQMYTQMNATGHTRQPCNTPTHSNDLLTGVLPLSEKTMIGVQGCETPHGGQCPQATCRFKDVLIKGLQTAGGGGSVNTQQTDGPTTSNFGGCVVTVPRTPIMETNAVFSLSVEEFYRLSASMRSIEQTIAYNMQTFYESQMSFYSSGGGGGGIGGCNSSSSNSGGSFWQNNNHANPGSAFRRPPVPTIPYTRSKPAPPPQYNPIYSNYATSSSYESLIRAPPNSLRANKQVVNESKNN